MSEKNYDWAVIGAGPAGIAAVGKLLDNRVDPSKLIWIDPEFKVGDFGTKWLHVPSNTRVSLFMQFLHHVKSFHFLEVAHTFELSTFDMNDTCQLKHMAAPLAWVTKRLRQQVDSQESMVTALKQTDRHWHLTVGDECVLAKQVVLATGSEPRHLAHPGLEVIDLKTAMDTEALKQACQPDDCVAVFGSSHSGVLAIHNLVESGVNNIVNFYRSPLRYALHLDGWTLYDNTGLKGTMAAWARKHMDVSTLPGLSRFYSNDETIAAQLPRCNKVIYTIGFDRRQHITLEGYPAMSYDRHTGIIAPGLFGVGIAFPEAQLTPLGAVAHRVGLWKFMDYLDRVVPIWVGYHV
ncbi:MAG: FAD-dependent oxidoreductase [Mariprofundaceae bacterium]|nr:FAD-dependent oxidoreductase [Mariprofundaceae bacterium]